MSDKDILLDIYGDESVVGNAAVYGAIVVPTPRLEYCEHFLEALKVSFGGKPSDRIHCKEMFMRIARQKTAWAHLDDSRVRDLFTQFARGLAALGVKCSVGFVDKGRTPAALPGVEHFPGQNLDDKTLTIFAFGAAVTPIVHANGRDRVRVWVDPDRTKIDWWGRRRQVLSALGFFTDLGPDNGPGKKFVPEPQATEKPALIDAADMLAYTAGQVLSGATRGDKSYFQTLWKILSPSKNEIFLGDDPKNNPYAPGAPGIT